VIPASPVSSMHPALVVRGDELHADRQPEIRRPEMMITWSPGSGDGFPVRTG
jgi:hypothetical protein